MPVPIHGIPQDIAQRDRLPVFDDAQQRARGGGADIDGPEPWLTAAHRRGKLVYHIARDQFFCAGVASTKGLEEGLEERGEEQKQDPPRTDQALNAPSQARNRQL